MKVGSIRVHPSVHEVRIPHGGKIVDFFAIGAQLYISFTYVDEKDGQLCCEGVNSADIIRIKLTKGDTEVYGVNGCEMRFIGTAVRRLITGVGGRTEIWYAFSEDNYG